MIRLNIVYGKLTTHLFSGIPKGVVLPHSALVATVRAFHFVVDPVKPGDIYLGT